MKPPVAPMAVLMLGMSAASLGAEPITATYSVQVTEAFQSGFAQSFEPLFALTLSFDPALGDGRGYGPPSFSTIPLPVPSRPEGVPLTLTTASTVHFQFVAPPSFDTFADARVTEFGLGVVGGATTSYSRFLELNFIGPVPEGSVPSPENFPIHLGLTGVSGTNFVFTGCVAQSARGCSGDFRISAFYRGVATLTDVQAPVIPEPATVILVTTGIGILTRRRIIAKFTEK